MSKQIKTNANTNVTGVLKFDSDCKVNPDSKSKFNDDLPPVQLYTLPSDAFVNFKLSLSPEDTELVKNMEAKYPQMTGEFKRICTSQYLMFLRKQNDYGPGNITFNSDLTDEQDLRLSLTGIVVRLNDKINRLVNLILRKNKTLNESVEDSFLDMSVYSKIALIVSSKKWGK